MTRRIFPALRRILIGTVLLAAIVVWIGLAVDTVSLARRRDALLPTVAPTRVPIATTAAPALTPTLPPPTVVASTVPTTTVAQQPTNFHPKTGRYIAAWLPDSSFDGENRASFEANADILDEVSPFWYSVNAAGGLLHGTDARDQSLVQLAHSKNVLVIPTIHNVVLTADPVPPVLLNPDRRRQHINNIVEEVLRYNYDGIDIDYEALAPTMREPYSIFITELGKALHDQNKLLTIAVHAKTSDWGGLGGFQDWVVLGHAVDRLRIMTYDYSWRGGGPGPVAPLYWVAEVAAYARKVVDPAKVVIGVPFYGYNWPLNGGNAVAQTWSMINGLIQENKLETNFRESDARGLVQENWINYSGRQAWFATSRGLEAKLGMVQQLDLAGIAIWRLGGEDPDNWNVIRRKLVQDPFESQRMLNQVLPEH